MGRALATRAQAPLRAPSCQPTKQYLSTALSPRCATLPLFARAPQGGYGTGDSIEVTFSQRTDRAGFVIGEILSRKTIDELLILDADLGPDPRAYTGVWRDDCTLMLVAGNTTGAVMPATGVFTLRVRDDIHELRDVRKFLHVASVASSPTLEGTFGAQTGLAGRLDPQRAVLPDLAARRYIPSPELTLETLRVGPLAWHRPIKYDRERDRTSECDPAYAQPDGLVGPRRPGAIPSYQLDEATTDLIRIAVETMAREPPSGLPYTLPPHGLPTDRLHSHAEGADAPPAPPWAPSMEQKQIDERAAAASIGPNGQVQRYRLTLDTAEDRLAFGLEHQANT